jgi:O-antigen/teichoic acid export membrane protein
MKSGPDRSADAAHAARGGLVQLLSMAGQALVPLFQILVARLYGVAVFGAYQASLAVIDVLIRAGLVGAIAGQHRFIAAHRAAGEEEMELRALGTGVRLVVTTSAGLAVVLALLGPLLARAWHEPSLAAVLPLMAPAVLFSALTLVLVAATLGAKVARISLYVRGLAEPALLLVASALGWAAGGGARRLALAHVAATGITAALAVVGCARVFGARRFFRALRAPHHPTFVRFGVPMALADLMNAVLQRADAFIITTFAGVDTLAVYAAAEYITRAIANPRYAFDSIAAPVLAEALEARDRERLRYNLALMTRWVTTAALPVAVTIVVLRRELLGLYGPAFVGGAGVMTVLAGAYLMVACLGLTPYVLSMSGRARAFLFSTALAVALNVTLGIALVPRFGPIGAAIAVLMGVTAYQVTLAALTWQTEHVHPFAAALVKPVLAAAAALAVELAAHALPIAPAARVAVVLAAGLVTYLVALLALGLAPEERRWAQRLLSRIR